MFICRSFFKSELHQSSSKDNGDDTKNKNSTEPTTTATTTTTNNPKPFKYTVDTPKPKVIYEVVNSSSTSGTGIGNPPPPSNLTGNTSNSPVGANPTGTSGSGGDGRKSFHCPKCGAVCTHVDAQISLSRFVKCEKCNHFFVLVSEERAKNLNISQMLNESNKQQAQPPKYTPPPPPKKIYEFLDKYIIGQEKAKKVISVAVYNHYKRIYNNLSSLPPKPTQQQQQQQHPAEVQG